MASETWHKVAEQWEAVDSGVVVGVWEGKHFTLEQVKVLRDEYFPGLPLQTRTTWEIVEETP